MLHHPVRRTGATTRAALALASHLLAPGARQALAVCATRDAARHLLARVGEVLQGLGLLEAARYDAGAGVLHCDLTGATVRFTTGGELERHRGQRFEEVVVDGQLQGEEHVMAASMRVRPAVAVPAVPAAPAELEGAFSRALEWTARSIQAEAAKAEPALSLAIDDGVVTYKIKRLPDRQVFYVNSPEVTAREIAAWERYSKADRAGLVAAPARPRKLSSR